MVLQPSVQGDPKAVSVTSKIWEETPTKELLVVRENMIRAMANTDDLATITPLYDLGDGVVRHEHNINAIRRHSIAIIDKILRVRDLAIVNPPAWREE